MTAQLPDDEVHLWHCDCGDPEVAARQSDYLALLNDDEVARQRRFAFEQDQLLFLVARALLRTVLSQYAPLPPAAWTFQQTARGKPHLAGPGSGFGLQFNVSHSESVAVCAVTRHRRVGVDVESAARRADDRVARRVLSPSELRQFVLAGAAEQRELFFRYWTLKEAYAKATGDGLSLRLRDFTFTWDEHQAPHITFHGVEPVPSGQWQFHQQIVKPHHYLAAAVHRPDACQLRFRTICSPPPLEKFELD